LYLSFYEANWQQVAGQCHAIIVLFLQSIITGANMSKEQRTSAMKKALEDSFKSFTAELVQRANLLDEREKELALAKAAFETKAQPNLETSSDVLTLNVGGVCMSVLRRTLTTVEGSMLAARFSGRWDDSLDKVRP
jgi:hypothetical protein